jgi:hypothetical protein
VTVAESADVTAERVARNDATFRAANEEIQDSAQEYEFSDPIPFVCECADPACRDLLRVPRAEYEEVRANPRRFLNVDGHEVAAGPHARVVERREVYIIVEKVGRAGEVVEQLNPRREEGAA